MVGNARKTPKARSLGAELREVREKVALSQRKLSSLATISNASLSRYETGERVPSPEDVASIVTAAGGDGDLRDRLIDMARDAAEPNWLAAGAGSRHKELTTLIEFERTATHILEVSPMLVPGLLQTESYARTIMAGLPAEELDMRVTTRVGRRDVLLRSGAPYFDALIDEHVLQRPIGGHSVMAHQLRHILTMAEQPNITVQIVPSNVEEWHLALEGAFILFRFPKAAPIVNLEHFRSSAFLYDEGDIHDYIQSGDNLRRVAMGPADSLELIARYADKMEVPQ
ncbi:helix-turn-helix domain-containing protein [Actinopolyspora halophila]|uniref:helix-turn-helix domain-containing protein n=1 Tax=Actinopolyspora halophila TaxID=1850 RepID=UPI000A03A97C|nr:helix-turn-helix transcriptional regulator [Actinopolyspora halophila]